MATYREVKGYSVKSVSSDPANVKEGQIWYNSSTKVIKVAPNIAAWASGNNMSNSRSTWDLLVLQQVQFQQEVHQAL